MNGLTPAAVAAAAAEVAAAVVAAAAAAAGVAADPLSQQLFRPVRLTSCAGS